LDPDGDEDLFDGIDAKDWEAEEYLAEFDDMTDEDVIDDRDE